MDGITTLITAQTEAANSTGVELGRYNNFITHIPATFFGWGFSGEDDATIQFSVDGGTTWNNLVIGGETVTLDSDNNARSIYGPGHYRVSKGVTTGEVGVAISRIKGGI